MIMLPLIVRVIRHLICNDPPAPPPARPFPTEAEIDAKLSEIAQARGAIDLNWRESITDLLVLLDIPNMFHARGLLYNELGGNGEYLGSSAQNVWMIGEVRRRFAFGQLY